LRSLYWVAATMGRVENMTDGKSQDRAERLKAALKENLKRRKAQARGRKVASDPGTPHPAPGQADKRDKPSD
jgi:hypothetical protein